MKFIVSSSSLQKQVQAVNSVINSSTVLPILDCILFDINKGELTLTATDLESTISSKLQIESKENGQICIPARLLIDTLKTFSEQPLTFSVDTKKFSIEISSDYGKYKLTGQNADDYPKIPTIENPSTFELGGKAMASALNKTIFATGNDDLRPVMSGVYFQLSTDNITFVATDAHKLVRYRRLDSKAKFNASFIVPKKPLNILKNLVTANDNEVKVAYNNTNATFSFDNYTLICRLIDGKYPNYDAVIPKENPNNMTVGRTPLLSSIKRVSIFSNKTTHQVRLKIAGSELNVSAEDLDYANEANERLTCQYVGDDMEIGFNSRFLIEMLANIEADDVTVEMSAPNRAGIIKPAVSDSSQEDILMLVMPVMLNN
jgi:DNA polymerase-3 subunit beta